MEDIPLYVYINLYIYIYTDEIHTIVDTLDVYNIFNMKHIDL